VLELFLNAKTFVPAAASTLGASAGAGVSTGVAGVAGGGGAPVATSAGGAVDPGDGTTVDGSVGVGVHLVRMSLFSRDSTGSGQMPGVAVLPSLLALKQVPSTESTVQGKVVEDPLPSAMERPKLLSFYVVQTLPTIRRDLNEKSSRFFDCKLPGFPRTLPPT
jgi:hypothetical protein